MRTSAARQEHQLSSHPAMPSIQKVACIKEGKFLASIQMNGKFIRDSKESQSFMVKFDDKRHPTMKKAKSPVDI